MYVVLLYSAPFLPLVCRAAVRAGTPIRNFGECFRSRRFVANTGFEFFYRLEIVRFDKSLDNMSRCETERQVPLPIQNNAGRCPTPHSSEKELSSKSSASALAT